MRERTVAQATHAFSLPHCLRAQARGLALLEAKGDEVAPQSPPGARRLQSLALGKPSSVAVLRDRALAPDGPGRACTLSVCESASVHLPSHEYRHPCLRPHVRSMLRACAARPSASLALCLCTCRTRRYSCTTRCGASLRGIRRTKANTNGSERAHRSRRRRSPSSALRCATGHRRLGARYILFFTT